MVNLRLSTGILIGLFLFLTIVSIPETVFADTIYVPDNYSTVQAAVNAANDGDIILVRNGTYNELAPGLTIGHSVTIKGSSADERPVIDVGTNGNIAINAPGVRLEGLALKASTSLLTGVVCMNANDTAIVNCSAEGASYYAIVSWGRVNLTVSGCYIHNSGTGIYLSAANNSTIADCDIELCPDGGIDCGSCEGLRITGCSLDQNGKNYQGPNIYIGGDRRSLVENCTLTGGRGMDINDCTDVNVTNVSIDSYSPFEEMRLDAIRMARCTATSLVNDTVTNGDRGVYVYDSSNVSISGCMLNHYGDGVYMSNVSDSRITGNNISAINIDYKYIPPIDCQFSKRNLIASNELISPHGAINLYNSSDNTLIDNACLLSNVQLSGSKNNTLTGNLINITMTPFIQDSANSSIYLNTIQCTNLDPDKYYSLNSSSPQVYRYNGNNFVGYLGNNWSSAPANGDQNGDGIVDPAYYFQWDNYRLMGAVSAYQVLPDTSVIYFAGGDSGISEGFYGYVTLARGGNLSGTSSCTLSAICGNASGDDIDAIPPLPSTITFEPGETEKVINITAIADHTTEGDEVLGLGITDLVNAIPGSQSTYNVTIFDISTSEPSAVSFYSDGEQAFWGSTVYLQVYRTGGDITAPCNISYAITGGDAVNGTDYACPASGQVHFNAFETWQGIPVTVLGEFDQEGTRSLTFGLYGPEGAVLTAPENCTLTIRDRYVYPGSVHNLMTGYGYSTIHDAITAADYGDLLVADSGTYSESFIYFNKYGLTLKGRDTGSGQPVISCMGCYIQVPSTIEGLNFTGNTFIQISYNGMGTRIGNCTIPYGLQVNGNNVRIAGCNVTGGISGYFNNSTIVNCSIKGAQAGVSLSYLDNGNTIAGNKIYDNEKGVAIEATCYNNTFYGNNLTNTVNVDDQSGTNHWNSTVPMAYEYKGQMLMNYTGNCWSDYGGEDHDKDGIGDSAYVSGLATDYYPRVYGSIYDSLDAAYVGDTVPDEMLLGQPYDVSVTFRNTGACPWSEAGLTRMLAWGDTSALGITGNCDNHGCGYPEYAIPEGTTVQPGESYTFNFTMTPSATGSFMVGMTMARNGEDTLVTGFGSAGYASVSVAPAPLDEGQASAMLVGVDIPNTILIGNPYNGSITFMNTGPEAWNESRLVRMLVWGSTAELGIHGNAYNYGCGYEEFRVPEGVTVQPGETYTWNFTFTPVAAGYTCIGLTMAHNRVDGSVVGFGQPTYESIIVTPASFYIELGNAWYQSNTVPTTMVVGQTYNVSVAYMNNGWAPWSDTDMVRLLAFGDTEQLGFTGDCYNYESGYPEYAIGNYEHVLLWQVHTFNFTVTPTAPGTFTIGFAMVQQNDFESVEPFGGNGYATVTVEPAPPGEPIGISNGSKAGRPPGE